MLAVYEATKCLRRSGKAYSISIVFSSLDRVETYKDKVVCTNGT